MAAIKLDMDENTKGIPKVKTMYVILGSKLPFVFVFSIFGCTPECF